MQPRHHVPTIHTHFSPHLRPAAHGSEQWQDQFGQGRCVTLCPVHARYCLPCRKFTGSGRYLSHTVEFSSDEDCHMFNHNHEPLVTFGNFRRSCQTFFLKPGQKLVRETFNCLQASQTTYYIDMSYLGHALNKLIWTSGAASRGNRPERFKSTLQNATKPISPNKCFRELRPKNIKL